MLGLAGARLISAEAFAAPAAPSAAATAQANALLAQMTPEEKIGQMTIFTSHWTSTGPEGDARGLVDEIRAGQCGNVFNARTVAYLRTLQNIAVSQSRLHVPLLFGYDVIHGYNTIFPIPLAQAASWDVAAIERADRIAAIEASAGGINWTFAPMVDIARDPRWGRIAEGAGEDPYLASTIARARVRGFQGPGFDDVSTILACVKHFAGYGAVQGGRDYNTTDMSERTLRETYLPPYHAAVDEGAWSVMSAFTDLNGVPATANRFLLRQVLRDEWGFRGFVVTDYDAVHELVAHGVAANDAAAARAALAAGVDMDMQSGAFLAQLPRELASGRVSPAEIDAAARRVLEAKAMLGLLSDPYRYIDDKREAALGDAPDHLVTAIDLARRSIVLLKNERGTLPLAAGAKIAVIGPLGDNRRDMLGCWSAAGKFERIETVLAAIRASQTGPAAIFAQGCEIASSDRSGFPAAVAAAQQADVVVMVLGESAGMSGEAASRTDIGLPGVQSELLAEIKKTGKPIVTVLINGRPLALEKEAALSDALVEAWAPGSAGGRPVADVLLGTFNPSGRLPVTFPRNVGQVPIFYNAKNTGRPVNPAKPGERYRSTYLDARSDPLFPFGFGLSYTSFVFSDFKLDRTVLKAGERLTATVRVTNAGQRDGAEVVQLYVRDLVASVTRPVLELKGFQRIELKAGESREVAFSVDAGQLAFWRGDMTWGVEPGDYQLMVGPDSRDLQVAGFELAGGER